LPPGEARIASAAKHVFSRLPQVFSSVAPTCSWTKSTAC